LGDSRNAKNIAALLSPEIRVCDNAALPEIIRLPIFLQLRALTTKKRILDADGSEARKSCKSKAAVSKLKFLSGSIDRHSNKGYI
jgi:hypothetical protein